MSERNMYGSRPCSECGSRFVAPYNGTAPHLPETARQYKTVLRCDDCGRVTVGVPFGDEEDCEYDEGEVL